jgi:hypoxanthine phosphoribosyltransferase
MDPQPRLHPTTPGRAAVRPDPHDAAFAHASEAELARILDFYGVAWEYEPHTFPLMWNLRGEVVESFTPDFFLPELDLHVELTTLRQKLVRKKNRKLRRMRELYPDVRVKLLYGKDFRALLLKFGRIGLADALSGTVGQTTPPRDAERRPAADGDRAADPTAAHGPSPGVAPQESTDPTHGAGARRASRARRGTGRPEARRVSGQPVEPGTGTPAAAEPAGRGARARRRRAAE